MQNRSTVDPANDFSFFKQAAPPVTAPVPEKPKTPAAIWKVNLIHRQKIENTMRNTKFTEKIFPTRADAEKWLVRNGFVFGMNPKFKATPEPYWFHNQDTPADHVTVKLYEMKLNEDSDSDDEWIGKLGGRFHS